MAQATPNCQRIQMEIDISYGTNAIWKINTIAALSECGGIVVVRGYAYEPFEWVIRSYYTIA